MAVLDDAQGSWYGVWTLGHWGRKDAISHIRWQMVSEIVFLLVDMTNGALYDLY